jgi:16S rRNA (guanine527-N7)-methyltransferase
MVLKDEQIREALAPFGVAVSPKLAAQVRTYMEKLMQWSRVVSLTTIVEPREVLQRHFGESFYAARHLTRRDGHLADIGSGAGFPGLALKLICPALKVALIEANQKKSAFLAEVARALSITDVLIVRKRVEEIDPASIASNYATIRAVGGLPEMVGWCHKALREGGRILLWTGREDAEAVQKFPGWAWLDASRIPCSEGRFLVVGDKSC